MGDTETLIERFVATLNERGLEPLFDLDVPAELRTGQTDLGMFEWKIRSAEPNPWVDRTRSQTAISPAFDL